MKINQQKISKSYFTIDVGLGQNFDLKPADAMLVSLVKSLSKKCGYCYSSRRDLAWRLNVSTVTIYNSLNRLKFKGLMKNAGISEYQTMRLELTEICNDYIEKIRSTYKKETNY